MRFVTPKLDKWSEQNSIEFWFKLENEQAYTTDAVLFTMSNYDGSFDYYQVYVEGGDLICAPFGSKDPKEPLLRFDSFRRAN